MGDSAYGTNFVESELVLALTADDTDEVDRLLWTQTAHELDQLARTFDDLAQAAREVLTSMGGGTDGG